MYARVSGTGNLRLTSSALEESDAAIAAALIKSPSGRVMRMAAWGNNFSPLSTIASSTGCRWLGERLMTLSTSLVAV
jgi:hypothetical protein